MKRSSVILLVLLTSCAPIKGEVEVKTQPVEIKHYLALDTTKLEAYYKNECEKLFTTQEEIDACVAEDLAKFIEQFTFKTT